MKIFNWAYKILKNLDFSDTTASYLNLAVNIIVLVVVAYILEAWPQTTGAGGISLPEKQ